MLAEADRNPVMAKILHSHSHKMRTLFADFLRKGQSLGQIDPGLDADLTSAVIIAVMDSSRTLAIRDPNIDLEKGLALLKTLVFRFLAPPGTAAIP